MNKPLIIISSLCLALLASGCHQQPEEAAAPRPVWVMSVGNSPANTTASYTGEVKSRYESNIGFRIAGKIIFKGTMARFARTFALSTRSGLPILSALRMVSQTVENDYLGAKILSMSAGIERGETILRTATQTGVFNPLVLQMIAVGEESGSLDDLMQEVADMYQADVEYDVKTLGAQIEPILIIFLGALVLVLALGVFLPIWDMSSVMLKGS